MYTRVGPHRTGIAVSLSHEILGTSYPTFTFLVLQVWQPPRDFLWGLLGMKSAVMVGFLEVELLLGRLMGCESPFLGE